MLADDCILRRSRAHRKCLLQARPMAKLFTCKNFEMQWRTPRDGRGTSGFLGKIPGTVARRLQNKEVRRQERGVSQQSCPTEMLAPRIAGMTTACMLHAHFGNICNFGTCLSLAGSSISSSRTKQAATTPHDKTRATLCSNMPGYPLAKCNPSPSSEARTRPRCTQELIGRSQDKLIFQYRQYSCVALLASQVGVKASAEGGTDTSGSQGAAPAAADADNNNDPPPAWPAYAGWMSALAIFGACFAAAVTADTHMDRLARLALSASSASSAAGTCLMPPFLLATVGAAVLGFIAVRVLTKVKAGQVVRLEGPSSHLASKSGTPTLGGISFIPVAAAVAVWWCQVSGVQGSQVGLVTALAAVTCAYGAIGLADDWASLRRRKNEGLSPRTKLLLQLLAGEFFLYWFSKTSLFASVGTTIKLVNGWSLPLGPLYWPFALFTMTAMSNGVNLTDGLDGLAAGVSAAALMAFAVMSLPLAAGTSVFSAALAGGCCGFLVHNRHKATMFMGDTGSLALGGALGAIAVSTGQLFPLLLASGVYLAETLSVILQTQPFCCRFPGMASA
eukprot:jgi/Mesvir1/24593/Mv21913-RA.1